MIKHWLVTGDTHGKVVERLANINTKPEETALIILGDAGINFYLNKTDENNKRNIQNTGFTIYCVRGNHEERPENIEGMRIVYNYEVMGMVYQEEKYLNIYYFIDGMTYLLGDYRVLVIGGAYSVDKHWRLGKYPVDAKWTGWFADEQLTSDEMAGIEEIYRDTRFPFDFILAHTCPIQYQPTELFLSGLDQSTVDNTMEVWLGELVKKIPWKIYLFGHYHDDMLIRPRVEMYYHDIEDLDTIYHRWVDKTEPLPWWLKRSVKYTLEEREIINNDKWCNNSCG